MAEIFISYRRRDWPFAAWMSQRLKSKFGKSKVFRDTEDLLGGEDYEESIENELDRCRVVIVVVGSEWSPSALSAFLIREIEKAIQRDRKIRLIPVVIEGADMEILQTLPANLERLARHHARKITDLNSDADFDRVVRDVKERVNLSAVRLIPWIVIGFLILLGMIAWLLYHQPGVGTVCASLAAGLLVMLLYVNTRRLIA